MENQKEFNKLEKAIVQWMIDSHTDVDVIAQLKALTFKNRKWTKVGFYIDFDIPKTLSPIEQKDYTIYKHKGNFALDDFPIIKSKDIEFAGQGIMTVKDGYIDQMELVTPGSFFNETVEDFILEKYTFGGQ